MRSMERSRELVPETQDETYGKECSVICNEDDIM